MAVESAEKFTGDVLTGRLTGGARPLVNLLGRATEGTFIKPVVDVVEKGLDILGNVIQKGTATVFPGGNPGYLAPSRGGIPKTTAATGRTKKSIQPRSSSRLASLAAQAGPQKNRGEQEAQENISKAYAAHRRVLNAEGGDINDQMNALAISVEPARVEETHTMPDGTEMAGATHGEYEEQMEGLMDKETPMLPDEEMEADYVDFVVNSTLDEEDKNYLESALAEDTKLSELFDQVVESASEFSGSGPIEGPGSEVSDSIPARLSDGEFVFTTKATDEIGADNLQRMMEDAEAGADERQGVVHGGVIDEEERAVPIQTRGSVAAQGNVPNVVKQSRQVEEEMLKSSPRRYYVPVSG